MTTANDDTMRIWDVGTGKELLNLTAENCNLSKSFLNGKALILKGIHRGARICDTLDWEYTPNINIFKCQRYANWLKANDTEVKKN